SISILPPWKPILPFAFPQRCARRKGPRAWRGPQIACASCSIISPSASMPEARHNNSKLAEMFAIASSFSSRVGTAVDVISCFMALLSFVESAPRAYRLKASNAAPPISTSIGTIPFTDVCLDSSSRKIVIECKFTSDVLQENWGKLSARSEHLYQLFAYLKHLERRGGVHENCEGLLLYPTRRPPG